MGFKALAARQRSSGTGTCLWGCRTQQACSKHTWAEATKCVVNEEVLAPMCRKQLLGNGMVGVALGGEGFLF